MILERQIQKIHPGCWEALEKLDKKYDEYELGHGWPKKQRFQQYLGGANINTIIVMREWPSFADWEAHMMAALADPEYAKLGDATNTMIDYIQIEGYMCLPGPQTTPGAILERQIQQIHPDGWQALEALDQRHTVYEKKHGWPDKRRYRLYLGGNSINTLIVEREWPSLAEWEKKIMESMQDPEGDALDKGEIDPIDSLQVEAYARLA